MKKILSKIVENWVTFALFLATVIIIIMVVRSCKARNDRESLANIQAKRNDSIIIITNRLHDTVRMVNTIYSGNINSDSLKYYKELAATTAAVNSKEVERLTTLVTSLKQSPNAKIDTVIIKDSFPVYAYHYQTKWLSYGASASRDSLTFNPPLMIHDSMELILTKKKNVLQARMVNYNPYSKVEFMRDYDFRTLSKPSHFGIGLSAGATYLNGSVQPYIGVGLNYNLIRF